jgi:hypothetical protein
MHQFTKFTFWNICLFSPLTKENSFKHKSWNGCDGCSTPPHPPALIAGPKGVGNVRPLCSSQLCGARVADLTAWSCGGDIRRFGRELRRGGLAFVLQTQSRVIYLFICCMRTVCLQLHCGGMKRGHRRQGDRGVCSPEHPQDQVVR